MRAIGVKMAWLGLCAAVLTLSAWAPVAQGATGDPLFVFVPTPPPGQIKPPPTGRFNGPCGLAVDSGGSFYVSDYYHHAIDVYGGSSDYNASGVNGATGFLTQLANEDPLDGPCESTLDSSDRLYVNNFDRNVVRFASFGAGTVIAGAGVDAAHPTGVAVDPTTGYAYVNDRTYVTGYDLNANRLTDGPNPLQIGLGSLGEGYGLATDATGRLYVADASDNTVKVYDQTISKTTPVQTITGPSGHFTSLRQGAVAVDRSNGVLYVLDDLQPAYTEKPQAQVDVFSLAGVYLGVLKYKVVDALPSGLAVDNSSGATKGRVYVTSGNTDQAGVYAYAAGSQIGSSSPPAIGLTVSAAGSGEGW